MKEAEQDVGPVRYIAKYSLRALKCVRLQLGHSDCQIEVITMGESKSPIESVNRSLSKSGNLKRNNSDLVRLLRCYSEFVYIQILR